MGRVRRRYTSPLQAPSRAVRRRLGRRGSSFATAILAVAVGTVVAGAPAHATTDAVTITSPTDGSTVVVAADPANVAAPVPVEVTFTSSGEPVTCALDDEPAAACASPYTFPSVQAGAHTLTVTAGSASTVSRFTLSTVALGEPPVSDGPFYRPQTGTRLRQTWSVRGARTRVRTLRLADLEGRVRVVLLCHGQGCRSARPYDARVSGSARLAHALWRWNLRPGTRVVIRISKQGYATKRFVVVVRKNVPPTVSWSWVR